MFDLSFLLGVDGKFYYGVRIITGDHDNAHADTSSVKIKITGDIATSDDVSMRVKEYLIVYAHFKKSTYEDVLVESDGDLGEILIVEPSMCHHGWADILVPSPQWYVEFITVYNRQSNESNGYTQTKDFPCYHWIGHDCRGVSCTSETGEQCVCVSL